MKNPKKRVCVDIDFDLPLEARDVKDRLAAIAAMTRLTAEHVFAVAVAMGIVAEGLDGADKA